MRDIELYKLWLKIMSTDFPQSVAIEEWLRNGISRVSTAPTKIAPEGGHPPFYPFVGYVNDDDDVLALMESLRELTINRSAHEATILRTVVARVIGTWDFENPRSLLAIRLSFRIGSIFKCVEVCDELARRAPQLIKSPPEIITGLVDMASDMGNPGRDLICLLLDQSVNDSQSIYLVPYLLTRAIESSVRADISKQRNLVLDLFVRYGGNLDKCGNALDAIEALTDVLIIHLRVDEASFNKEQVSKLKDIKRYLDEDILIENRASLAFIYGTSMPWRVRAKDYYMTNLEKELLHQDQNVK